jgi:hypothetical protein
VDAKAAAANLIFLFERILLLTILGWLAGQISRVILLNMAVRPALCLRNDHLTLYLFTLSRLPLPLKIILISIG